MEMTDLKKLGNLAKVYHDLVDNAERENFIRDVDQRRGPYDAEIVEGCSPSWHVFTCLPAHEKIAAGHLVGRRFGIYLPERERQGFTRGRFWKRRSLLLPGYIFVFTWDLLRHKRRIEACPGILHVLMQGQNPAVIPDELINRIRRAENGERPISYDVEVEQVIRKGRRRESRKYKKTVLITTDEITAVHSYGWRSGDDELGHDQPERRVSAFHKAMGLDKAA